MFKRTEKTYHQQAGSERTVGTKRRPYMFPGDALSLVLILFLLQDQLDEKLLELLIAVVDTKLLKAEGERERLEGS